MINNLNHSDRSYAVAVSDGVYLYLLLRLRRNWKGELFYVFPNQRGNRHNPHGSYHRDGRVHHKSFDKKFLARQGLRPDRNFVGAEQLLTTVVSAVEAHLYPLCNPAEFDDIVKIPIGLISPERYRTYIAVDLVEAHGKPQISSGDRIVEQQVFGDAVPWIVVTVLESQQRRPRAIQRAI